MTSFCAILDRAASHVPDKPLFVFPETRWRREEGLTYERLASRAAAARGVIAESAAAGDRALLLFPIGAEFWEAFIGCLAAGVIAVPLHTPNLNRPSDLIAGVCRDCDPSLILTDSGTAELIERRSQQHAYLDGRPILTSDAWRDEARGFSFVDSAHEATAFLQYTSGSTSQPKGVQVSHGNLLANAELIRKQMGIRMQQDFAVTWLPHYHDMGLVGSYLETLYTHNTSWCLPPEEFVLHPERWLQLISRTRATICGGPDFGYRRCVQKISPDQLEGIDLTSWRVAYVGAEKIRPDTLSSFLHKFSAYGFRNDAFFPCYGLAEATLMATGGPVAAAPVFRDISSAALEDGRIAPPTSQTDRTTLVGCGKTISGSQVAVIDLESGVALAEDRIGEVCLAGPSVTSGYFGGEQRQENLFCDVEIDGRTTRFLRSGDLGFLSQGELFITGRLSERMIVRGKNLYPEDVEERTCAAHQAIAPGGAIAFSTDLDGSEELIIAAELDRSAVRTAPHGDVIAAIRQEVVASCGVSPAEVVLLRPATLPRTTSGKPMRFALREQFVGQTLECLARETG